MNTKYNTSTSRQSINFSPNKRCLSADGLSLLPSALRPRLLKRYSIISVVLLSSFICLGMTDDVSAASLTLTIPDSPVTLNLMPSSSEATFAKSSANTISVKSDAPFGYTLTIKGKSSDNSLISSSGGSSGSKIQSITSSITEDAFKTNTSHNNKWGYSPSKLNSSNNTNYLAGPTTTATNTIDKTTSANVSSVNNYTLTIAAKVDSTVPSGKYSNNITISATANSTSYNITYNLQSGSGGPSPLTQSGSTVNSTIALSSSVPTKTNYSFQGWCNKTPTNNNGTNPTCSGTKYNASATYTLSTTPASNTFTLYAMWKYYPSLTSFSCSNLGVNETVDTTDGIPIMKVGAQCWMWKNLDEVYIWKDAGSICPLGWVLPTQDQFQSLLDTIGTGSELYNAGWSGDYWSSTKSGKAGYYLSVSSSAASLLESDWRHNYSEITKNVRCATT